MPEPDKGEIVVYSEQNFEGDSQKFTKDHETLKKDSWNDRIASFKVGPHTRVEFFEHEEYEGKNHSFEKDHKELKEFNLHKKISAFKITTY